MGVRMKRKLKCDCLKWVRLGKSFLGFNNKRVRRIGTLEFIFMESFSYVIYFRCANLLVLIYSLYQLYLSSNRFCLLLSWKYSKKLKSHQASGVPMLETWTKRLKRGWFYEKHKCFCYKALKTILVILFYITHCI